MCLIVDTDAGPLQVKLGVGVGTDVGFKDWTVSGHIAGFGLSIRKKMGISIAGSEITLDLRNSVCRVVVFLFSDMRHGATRRWPLELAFDSNAFSDN